MKPFQYATAYSKESAVDLVSDNGRFFAGGIDVLGELKDQLDNPKILVNIKELPDAQTITPAAGVWTIGNAVTLVELATNEDIKDAFPGIAQAAREVGSPQIRNVATLGGNLGQHSRCWYYRHKDIICLKKDGERCYARTGKNRHHSLFSGNPCISPVVSNLGTALTVLDTVVLLYREGETRRLSVSELYDTAWNNSLAHNSLLPGDLILSVEIPTRREASAYLQISEKSEFDWALVSCAAAAHLDGGRLVDPRIALGAVAPVPYQRADVHTFLEGKTLTPALAAEAAELLLSDARPRSDNGYKIPMAKALVQRTLMRLVSS